jgi:hypothetical protein
MEWMLFLLVALAIGVVIFVVWSQKFRRKLKGSARAQIEREWERVASLSDPVRRVLEADMVLDHALSLLQVQGTMGEKLKKAGQRFSHLDAVWSAHKLRNRLAHEPGSTLKTHEAERALRTFRRAIDQLM